MGVVYKARQVNLNRICALKMILAGAHAGPEAAARFLSEAETVARLEHPAIVQIHHLGDHDGRPYLELEYVDGGSLDDRSDGTPLPAGEAAELVEALARAIHYSHGLGVVHRDLKPSNILLTHDGRREDRRLRPGEDARHRQPDHGVGPDPGHPQLHGPRAGQRRRQAGRAVGRHLRPGGDPLRPPHGSPAVPRGDDPRDAPAGPGGGPRPPVPPPALAAARRRDDHPEVPPEAPRRPLRHGGGTRGGPAPLPRP